MQIKIRQRKSDIAAGLEGFHSRAPLSSPHGIRRGHPLGIDV